MLIAFTMDLVTKNNAQLHLKIIQPMHNVKNIFLHVLCQIQRRDV